MTHYPGPAFGPSGGLGGLAGALATVPHQRGDRREKRKVQYLRKTAARDGSLLALGDLIADHLS